MGYSAVALLQKEGAKMMNTTVAVVLVCLVLFFAIVAGFLLFEHTKKFNFLGQLARSSDARIEYLYPGNQKAGFPKGVRNIVLRSESGKPFSALIAMELVAPIIGKEGSLDPFGFVRSNDQGVAVFAAYLGGGSVDLVFIVLHDDGKVYPIRVSTSNEDQELHPTVVYPGHWWQKLGFYG